MASERVKTKHIVLGAACVLTVVIVATSIVSALLLRDREVETWRRQMADLSLLLAEQTSQTMSSAQLAMDSIAERIEAMKITGDAELRQRTHGGAMYEFLRDKISGLPQVDVATIVAANGDVINFTRSFPAPAINLADRDYFRVRRDSAAPELFVSEAVRNKGNGKWIFYLSHRLNDPHGRFLGLVLVGISVDQFSDFYARLGTTFGDGAAITLYRRDFSVLTRWPRQEEMIGKKNLTGTSYLVVEEMKKSNDVIYTAGPRIFASGVPVARLGAVRVLDRFPLILNLTVTEDFFLATWRHATKLIAAFAVGSIICLVIAAIVLLRIARQRERSDGLLRGLADQVPGLLFQFQQFADGRVAFPYGNRKFLQLYGEMPAQVDIGHASIFSFCHEDDRDNVLASMKQSAATLQPWHAEYRLALPGKGISWRRGDAQPQKLADGSVLWHGYIADVTEQKQFEANLARESEKNRLLLHNASDGIHILDAHGNVIEASDSFCAMLGYTRMEIIGMNLCHWDTRIRPDKVDRLITRRLEQPGITTFETQHRCKDGSTFDVEVTNQALELDGQMALYNASRDISDRKRADEELRIAGIAFESQEGMILTDASGVIMRVNGAFKRLTGYSAEEVIGKTPALLKSGRQDLAFYQRMWNLLIDTGYWQGEVWNRRKDGEIYAEWLTISAVKTPDGSTTHYLGAFSEITRNKEAEAEIHRLAYYDPLTHLPNRRLLYDRISQALVGSRRTGHFGALLFLDLDNFKNLNDTRGHDVGDRLLTETAQRLQDQVRQGDTVARLGGDEFVVVLEDLSADTPEAVVQAGQVGEKVREALAQPYDLEGRDFHCPASLGVALFRGNEESVDTLLKHADLAMYKAKSAGRNALRFFDPDMQIALDERSALEADLRLALNCRQLLLHYQAQFDGSRRIIGAEALLRWAHPERGLMPPGDFISLAEETDLIVPIGQWVLETTCAQIKAWSTVPTTRALRLAVNVSARQFRRPEFVHLVSDVLAKTGADPTRLKIELTESVVLDDVDDTLEKMQALKELGVGFALDDFGTGHSSLSYLTRLPLDQLKIDRSFVIKLPGNPNDAIVAQTIITMGKSLGMDVIAEGVETEAQQAFLARHNCHVYQGFLFSAPLPLEELEELVMRA